MRQTPQIAKPLVHGLAHSLVVALVACGGGEAGSPATTPASPTGSPTASSTDSEGPTDPLTDDTAAPTDTASTVTDTASTADTGSTEVPVPQVDCTALPDLPVTYTTLQWVSPAEDFTLAPDGTMLAVQGGHLQATEWGGAQTILVPNLGDVRGTRMLADGRMALAHIESGAVLVVDPATGSQIVHSGLTNPNGIAIGADGWIYVAGGSRIVRIEPDLGTQEVVAELNNRSFDGLSFSPTYDRLYFNEEVGRVHWVDFDATGQPGPVQDGPSIPIGAFSLLDGMAVDACGNLYTTEMGSTVWRVATDGTVEKVFEVSGVGILPALNFGSGVGDWQADKLYVMDFLGKMYEVDVGVPGKWEPHLP